jgi:hypothetical protein
MDDKKLREIGRMVAGPRPSLYLPAPPASPRSRTVGPRFIIVVGRRDLNDAPAPEEFWNLLNEVPMPEGLAALSSLNLATSRLDYLSPQHDSLMREFLSEKREAQVREFISSTKRDGSPVRLFSRVNLLMLQRLAISMSSPAPDKENSPKTILGELALLANDYVTGSRLRREAPQFDYIAMMIEAMPTWDITNPPDLAYGLTRAFRMLQTHLESDDPYVVELRSKLPVDFSTGTFDGLSIGDYIACVFGMYSWLNTLDASKLIEGEIGSVIDTEGFLSATHFSKASFDSFIAARSRTPDQFRNEFPTLQVGSPAALADALASDRFIADTLATRKYPLCLIEPTKVVCLDSTFLSELLISGLYWQLVERLSRKDADIFMTLWGRLLELHVGEVMRWHYPSSFSPLATDVAYSGGQIDLLLDFGDDVVIFELKGSLLRIASKYDRDPEAFKSDFATKFVENEAGAPKALRQLANACTEAIKGRLKLATKPKRVFPVLVGAEPSLDSFWVNRYADNLFETIVGPELRPAIRPITLMSAEALENAVPYAAAGDISWPALLELRFLHNNSKVVDYSVDQAIYDWRVAKGLDVRRNEFMLSTYSEVFQSVLARYKGED